MSDDLSKVDWNRPIEAVRACGRIAVVEPAGMPSQQNMHYAGRIESMRYAFDKNGYPLSSLCPWRIRNVAEVPRNSEAPSDDIAKRMEALVAKIAVAPNSAIAWFLRDEARALLAELAPVDPDVVEARQIAEGMEYCWSARDRMTANIDAAILSAIRRGRALERDSREG